MDLSSRRGQTGEFSIEPIPTHSHSHELPHGVPIGVGKTRYQPNHGILDLKVIPIP